MLMFFFLRNIFIDLCFNTHFLTNEEWTFHISSYIDGLKMWLICCVACGWFLYFSSYIACVCTYILVWSHCCMIMRKIFWFNCHLVYVLLDNKTDKSCTLWFSCICVLLKVDIPKEKKRTFNFLWEGGNLLWYELSS